MHRIIPLFSLYIIIGIATACTTRQQSTAPAVNPNDSLAFMTSRGINSLVSDSGVLRYKIVAEQWDIYNTTQPATWKFMQGLLMQRFGQDKHVDLYIQADTAYFHRQNLWELRGRVEVRNIQGTVFRTSELFYDLQKHEFWSNQFMRITTPDRELQGTTFRSDEQMTNYFVSNSAGHVPMKDTQGTAGEAAPDAESPEETADRPPVKPVLKLKEVHSK